MLDNMCSNPWIMASFIQNPNNHIQILRPGSSLTKLDSSVLVATCRIS